MHLIQNIKINNMESINLKHKRLLATSFLLIFLILLDTGESSASPNNHYKNKEDFIHHHNHNNHNHQPIESSQQQHVSSKMEDKSMKNMDEMPGQIEVEIPTADGKKTVLPLSMQALNELRQLIPLLHKSFKFPGLQEELPAKNMNFMPGPQNPTPKLQQQQQLPQQKFVNPNPIRKFTVNQIPKFNVNFSVDKPRVQVRPRKNGRKFWDNFYSHMIVNGDDYKGSDEASTQVRKDEDIRKAKLREMTGFKDSIEEQNMPQIIASNSGVKLIFPEFHPTQRRQNRPQFPQARSHGAIPDLNLLGLGNGEKIGEEDPVFVWKRRSGSDLPPRAQILSHQFGGKHPRRFGNNRNFKPRKPLIPEHWNNPFGTAFEEHDIQMGAYPFYNNFQNSHRGLGFGVGFGLNGEARIPKRKPSMYSLSHFKNRGKSEAGLLKSGHKHHTPHEKADKDASTPGKDSYEHPKESWKKSGKQVSSLESVEDADTLEKFGTYSQGQKKLRKIVVGSSESIEIIQKNKSKSKSKSKNKSMGKSKSKYDSTSGSSSNSNEQEDKKDKADKTELKSKPRTSLKSRHYNSGAFFEPNPWVIKSGLVLHEDSEEGDEQQENNKQINQFQRNKMTFSKFIPKNPPTTKDMKKPLELEKHDQSKVTKPSKATIVTDLSNSKSKEGPAGNSKNDKEKSLASLASSFSRSTNSNTKKQEKGSNTQNTPVSPKSLQITEIKPAESSKNLATSSTQKETKGLILSSLSSEKKNEKSPSVKSSASRN